jgi:hypothetical protein
MSRARLNVRFRAKDKFIVMVKVRVRFSFRVICRVRVVLGEEFGLTFWLGLVLGFGLGLLLGLG